MVIGDVVKINDDNITGVVTAVNDAADTHTITWDTGTTFTYVTSLVDWDHE